VPRETIANYTTCFVAADKTAMDVQNGRSEKFAINVQSITGIDSVHVFVLLNHNRTGLTLQCYV